jgi:hypothetical protein
MGRLNDMGGPDFWRPGLGDSGPSPINMDIAKMHGMDGRV